MRGEPDDRTEFDLKDEELGYVMGHHIGSNFGESNKSFEGDIFFLHFTTSI